MSQESSSQINLKLVKHVGQGVTKVVKLMQQLRDNLVNQNRGRVKS